VAGTVKKLLLLCLVLGGTAFADQVNCIKWKNSGGTTVGTYCKPFTVKAGPNVSFSDDQLTRVLTINSGYGYGSVRDSGAVGDGVADDTAAIQAAVTAACASTYSRLIYFPAGAYRITVPPSGVAIQISCPGVVFLGDGGFRLGTTPDAGGSKLQVYGGPGTVFQINTDNGDAYTDADYDGYEGTRFENLQAAYVGSSTSALTNGFGNYGTNVYFVKDWKGGGQHWRNVTVSNFNYGFWGVQSDINAFYDVMFRQNKVGVYLGPRSDQNDFYGLYGLHNDNLFTGDANDTKFWGGVSNSDGSSSSTAFNFPGAYSGTTKNIHWNDFWFENSDGQASTAIDSFVQIGVGATNQVTDFYFHSPVTINNISPTTPRTVYIANVGNADGIFVEGLQGPTQDAILEFTGATSPASVVIRQDRTNYTNYVNAGVGSPKVLITGIVSGSNTMLLENVTDASFTALRIRGGATATQNREIRWAGFNNVTDWQDQVSSAHNRNIVDTVSAVNRIALTQGGATALNSIGATADNFNITSGTGTGGVAGGDGAGNTTWTITSAGKGTFNGGLVSAAATPTVAASQLGLGTTVGFGAGSSGTAVTTTTKGAGSGPTTPQTIVNYLKVNIGGTDYYIPLVQ
jgi:hypothetical protein